jgi:hypothetical protein
MNTIQTNILNQVNTHGSFTFRSTYNKTNGRYQGMRTVRAAKALFQSREVDMKVEQLPGLTKRYVLTKLN